MKNILNYFDSHFLSGENILEDILFPGTSFREVRFPLQKIKRLALNPDNTSKLFTDLRKFILFTVYLFVSSTHILVYPSKGVVNI